MTPELELARETTMNNLRDAIEKSIASVRERDIALFAQAKLGKNDDIKTVLHKAMKSFNDRKALLTTIDTLTELLESCSYAIHEASMDHEKGRLSVDGETAIERALGAIATAIRKLEKQHG